MKQYYVDWSKLVQIVILMGATVYLGVEDVISQDTVALVVGGAVGYVFGNGRSAKNNEPPSPLVGHK